MLCHLAAQFPVFAADFLQHGRQLRRRFREETITDLLMGSLLAIGGAQIRVEFPDEPVTGADMEWNFINRTDGTFFRILLQAKQAFGDGKAWTRHCYRELLHESGTPKTLQAKTLCDTARSDPATYPLYILYHSELTCALARTAGVAVINGVNLADGFAIERLALSATTKASRTRNKSLSVIHPLLFELNDIFCPSRVMPTGIVARAPTAIGGPFVMTFANGRPIVGTPIPPTPRDIHDRLTGLREDIAKRAGFDAALPPVPPITTNIPAELAHHVSARPDHAEGLERIIPLRRWRITFMSATPERAS